MLKGPPIFFSGPDFRGYFVIEDDVRDSIEEADAAAFLTLCDQMGLLLRRLDYERELAQEKRGALPRMKLCLGR